MPHKTVVNWSEELAFDVELDGHHFMVDADPQFGGKNRGPRPKALLLAGLEQGVGAQLLQMAGRLQPSHLVAREQRHGSWPAWQAARAWMWRRCWTR